MDIEANDNRIPINEKRSEEQHTSSSESDQKINNIEKELKQLKKNFEKCEYKKIIDHYGKLHAALLTMVGVVLAVVTIVVAIPTVINIVTYEKRMKELDSMIYTQKYISEAEYADSDETRIEKYTAAIEHDDKNPELYYRRGQIYYQNNNYDKAIADCKKAIQLNDDYDNAHFLLGRIYYSNGDYESVINEMQAVDNSDSKQEINAYLSCAYYYLENYEKAISCLSNTYRVNEEYNTGENLYRLSVQSYIHLGQFGNALGVVDDYLRHCRRVGDVEECAIELNDICKATNNMDYTYQIDNKLQELSWERNEKREQLGRSDMDEMYVLQKDDELYNLLLSDVNSLSMVISIKNN